MTHRQRIHSSQRSALCSGLTQPAGQPSGSSRPDGSAALMASVCLGLGLISAFWILYFAFWILDFGFQKTKTRPSLSQIGFPLVPTKFVYTLAAYLSCTCEAATETASQARAAFLVCSSACDKCFRVDASRRSLAICAVQLCLSATEINCFKLAMCSGDCFFLRGALVSICAIFDFDSLNWDFRF